MAPATPKPNVTNVDRYEVMGMVKSRGHSLADLAEQNGLHPSTVQTAIYRLQPSGNRVIATFLGVSVHDLWPEWFDAAGNVIADSTKRKAETDAETRQNGVAA